MLGTAGLSGLYRLGDPLNLRMTGIVINQPDLPYWCVGILDWLARVQALQQASGELKVYREFLRQCLEEGLSYDYVNEKTGKKTTLHGPAAIYALHQEYGLRLEAEANK